MAARLLGAEELVDHLNELGVDAPNIVAEIQDHIAALEADNAAMLDLLRRWTVADGDVGTSGYALMTPAERAAFEIYEEACRSVAMPHPGTALLEERRKALAQRDAAMKLSSMTQQTVEMLNARIDQDDRDHAKALVRARNEGLEEAAEWARVNTENGEANALVLRLMKEPEE